MSLINQMLRDLEKRRKSTGSYAPGREGQAVFSAPGTSHRAIYFAVIGVFLMGAVWVALEIVPRQLQVAQKPLPAIPSSTPVDVPVPAELVKVPSVVSMEENNSLTASATDNTDSVIPSTTEPQLLLKVSVLEEERSARLAFEFEKQPAFSWALQEREKNKLEILLERMIGAEGFELPVLAGPILKNLTSEATEDGLLLTLEMSPGSRFKTLELPADSFFGDRLLFEFFAATEVVSRRPAAVVAEVKPKTSQAAAKISAPVDKKLTKKTLQLSPAEKAAQAYQTALKQLQGNNRLAAETNFSHALQLQPNLLDARLQLISLLQQQQRTVEATTLLEAGLQLAPTDPQLRKVYARQLMANGQLSPAIDTLLSDPQPDIADDIEYHALLAALHQEAGQHLPAIEKYQYLLQLRPQEALWWLGLAISLEQTGEAERAKEAYQQAISLPGLRDDLQSYIQTRLQVL